MEPDDRPWWEPDPNRELPRVTIPQWGLSPSFWSAVPVFVRQLLAAPNAARTLVGCVLLEGKPVQRVELCGVLVEVVSRANYTVLQLDDGTGTLRLLMTVNEDELLYGPASDPDIIELRRTVRLGSTVKAIGRLNEHKGEREVLVDFISRASGPLEEARWWEMAVRAQGGLDGGLGFHEIDPHQPLPPLPAPPAPPPDLRDPEAVWKISDPDWAERYAKQRPGPPVGPGPAVVAAPNTWTDPQGGAGRPRPHASFPAAAAAHAAAGSGGRGTGDGSGTAGQPSGPGGAFRPAAPVRSAAPLGPPHVYPPSGVVAAPPPRLNPEAERALAAVAAAAADYDSMFGRPQVAVGVPEQPWPSTSAPGNPRPPAQAAQPPNHARNPAQNFSTYPQQGHTRPGSILAAAQRPLTHSAAAVQLQGPGSGLPDLGPGPGPPHGRPSESSSPGPGPAGVPDRDPEGAGAAAGSRWMWPSAQPPVPRQLPQPPEGQSEERGEQAQGSEPAPAPAPRRAATGVLGSLRGLRSFHPVPPTWEQQPPKRPRQTG